MTWKIWYDDASTFSSKDGRPEESPLLGAVVIAMRNVDSDKVLWCGVSHYFYRTDKERWFEVDEAGFWDFLLANIHNVTAYRPGRWMYPTKDFLKLKDEAVEWANG